MKSIPKAQKNNQPHSGVLVIAPVAMLLLVVVGLIGASWVNAQQGAAAPTTLGAPGTKGSAGALVIPGGPTALWQRLPTGLKALFGASDVKKIDANGAEIVNLKSGAIDKSLINKVDAEKYVKDEIAKAVAAVIAGGGTPPATPVTPTQPVVAAPVISSFTATPTAPAVGGQVTLSWSLSGGAPTSLSLDGGTTGLGTTTVDRLVGMGSKQYTLVVNNSAGSSIKEVIVTAANAPVVPAPPVVPAVTPPAGAPTSTLQLVTTTGTQIKMGGMFQGAIATSLADRDTICRENFGADSMAASLFDVKAQMNPSMLSALHTLSQDKVSARSASITGNMALLVSDFVDQKNARGEQKVGVAEFPLLLDFKNNGYDGQPSISEDVFVNGTTGSGLNDEGRSIRPANVAYSSVALPCINKSTSKLVFSREKIAPSASDVQKEAVCQRVSTVLGAINSDGVLSRTVKNYALFGSGYFTVASSADRWYYHSRWKEIQPYYVSPYESSDTLNTYERGWLDQSLTPHPPTASELTINRTNFPALSVACYLK